MPLEPPELLIQPLSQDHSAPEDGPARVSSTEGKRPGLKPWRWASLSWFWSSWKARQLRNLPRVTQRVRGDSRLRIDSPL